MTKQENSVKGRERGERVEERRKKLEGRASGINIFLEIVKKDNELKTGQSFSALCTIEAPFSPFIFPFLRICFFFKHKLMGLIMDSLFKDYYVFNHRNFQRVGYAYSSVDMFEMKITMLPS